MEKENIVSEQEHALDCRLLGLNGIAWFRKCESSQSTKATAEHGYTDLLEIRLYHKGIQPLGINEREFTVQGGDILIIPPNAVYSSYPLPRYRVSYHSILLQPTGSILNLNADSSSMLIAALLEMHAICYAGSDEAEKLVENSFTHLSSGSALARMRGLGELACLLLSLPDACHQRKSRPYSPSVRAAIDYINDTLTTRVDLEEVANVAGMSLSYFKTQFRKETGMTPLYYINWRKIAHAKRLLAHGYSVTDTALQLDFNSSAYFSTVFRSITSRTPRQYQQFVEEEMKKQRHVDR